MNKLQTAVEKIFLTIDPNVQMREAPQKLRTKHSIF